MPTPYFSGKVLNVHSYRKFLPTSCLVVVGGGLSAGPRQPPLMRISLPRQDLLGEERWPISQRRRAKSLFLNGLLLGSICTGIQVKLINHCQAVRIKQRILRAYSESGSVR